MTEQADPPPTQAPFGSLEAYVALPRMTSLVLSPDGGRLVAAVSAPNPAGTGYRTSLWQLDPAGVVAPRRLTRGASGESSAAFAPDGDLLFTARRSDPDAPPGAAGAGAADDVASVWRLPAAGGEARIAAARPGGVSALSVARDSGDLVLISPTFPAAVTAEDDAAIRRRRKDGGIDAILHEQYPIRSWDHDLGPDHPRLFHAAPGGEPAVLRDLTPDPGPAFVEEAVAVTPDGGSVVVVESVPIRGGTRERLIVVDVATGGRRILIEEAEADFGDPVVAPDGRRVMALRWPFSTPTSSSQPMLWLVDLESGSARRVAPSFDRWPSAAVWAPDGSAVFVTADDHGHRPVFRIDLDDDSVTRLTGDHGCYAAVCPSPDGGALYALRSAMDAPPSAVRIDARTVAAQPVPIPSPVPELTLPGRAVQVTTTAADGATVHSWLCLPDGASPDTPAPLLLWVHGGPNHSANDWSWRWNPWLMVARGYAVLQPDFALSTGYGQAFLERGWGRWGAEPYTDLMAATDAACARDDVDADRTAAMGGSFGGYMANWIAGHTDRFRGIVSHAALWNLPAFAATTDHAHYWYRELTAEMTAANSPHAAVGSITTPMLVVHGDKDYRVPVGEGLALYAQLAAHAQAEGRPMPHKFLYFPQENHWVLTPNHARIWYETVFAFLDHTVHGAAWRVPDALR